MDRLTARARLTWSCRVAATATGAGSSSRARNPLAALSAEVFENIVDYALPRPPSRVKHPENLAGLKCLLRHVLERPWRRMWLPKMKTSSPRWHQLVRNWDYLQEEIFFRTEKTAPELEMELKEFGITFSSATHVACV